MKYLCLSLLAISTVTHAEFVDDRENDYFKPIKVSTQKQFNYILDNLILSSAMAVELKDNFKVTSQILKDYDSVLKYKDLSCKAYEITKTLDDFFKTNKEFARNMDKKRVEFFTSASKLSGIEISGCDAIHRTYFNNLVEKTSK